MSELNVSVEDLSPVQKRIQVTVPAPLVDKAFETVVSKLQRNARIKGFRPGKVPRNVVEKMYGHDIQHEVANQVVNDTYFDVLRQHDIRAVDNPRVENDHAHRGSEFKYTATVEVLAPVELKTYKGLKLQKPKAEATDAQVQQTIDQLLDSRAKLEEVTEPREIQEGDYAVIDLKTTEDGKPIAKLSADGFTIPVGSKMVFPELDTALIGRKPGEEGSVDVLMPDDAADKSLAGKKLVLSFAVKSLKARVRPELTDEYAKELGDFQTVDDLRKRVREDLERHLADYSERAVREDALTKLIEANPIEVSQGLVNRETQELMQRAAHDYEQRGIDASRLDQNRMWDELRPTAERRIRTELLLDAIADKENLQVDDAVIERYYEREAARSGATLETVRQAHQHLKEQLGDRLRLDEALQLVIREAKVEEVETPSDALEG